MFFISGFYVQCIIRMIKGTETTRLCEFKSLHALWEFSVLQAALNLSKCHFLLNQKVLLNRPQDHNEATINM